jgi:hypothetical protein
LIRTTIKYPRKEETFLSEDTVTTLKKIEPDRRER